MIFDLTLIGLGITLEPFPIIALILILSGEKGLRKALVFVLAWLACLTLVIGVTVAITGGKPPAPSTAPTTAALVVKGVLGVVLVIVGLRHRAKIGRPTKEPAWMARLDTLGSWTAAGLAVFLQPWSLVAAGAATVVAAQVSTAGEYAALIYFIVLSTATLLALLLYATFKPESSRARLDALRRWINGHRDQAIVILSLALGFWLIGKSIYGLVAG
ncbi:MAG TPA: GAP family protein [Acidimicrobiales bacterium]|nr:GAP family protein [Acidimicrobiales bacterium]